MHFLRKIAVVLGLVSIANISFAAAPQYHEIIEGSPSAKLVVQEFASITCPHCAEFNNNDYPELKKRYIDTGKIQFIFRDIPTAPGNLAVAAAAIARCAPEGRGRGLIDMMYKHQVEWMRNPNMLRGYVQLAGMSGDDVDACLNSEAIRNAMQESINRSTTTYKITQTPTFYVGDTKFAYTGFQELCDLIDKCLGKTK